MQSQNFLKKLLKTLLIISVFLAGLVTLVQWGAGLLSRNLINQKIKPLVRGELNVEDVAIRIFGPSVTLKNVTLKSPESQSPPVILRVDAVTLKAALRGLLHARIEKPELILEGPSLWVGPSQNTSSWPALLSQKMPVIPIERLTIHEGEFQLAGSTDSAHTFTVQQITLECQTKSQDPQNPWPVQYQVSGELPGEPPGIFESDGELEKSQGKTNFKGRLTLENISLATLAKFFLESPEVEFTQGTLGLSSEFRCSNNHLVSSNIITMERLQAKLTKKKKFFGLSSRNVETFLNMEKVSFVLPITGNLTDPQFGITSAVQQIIYQALQGQMEEEGLRKFSERGGNYIGKRLDSALKNLLKKKKK